MKGGGDNHVIWDQLVQLIQRAQSSGQSFASSHRTGAMVLSLGPSLRDRHGGPLLFSPRFLCLFSLSFSSFYLFICLSHSFSLVFLIAFIIFFLSLLKVASSTEVSSADNPVRSAHLIKTPSNRFCIFMQSDFILKFHAL